MAKVFDRDLLAQAYFPRDTHAVKLPILRSGANVVISTDEITHAGFSIPVEVQDALKRVSQLGLKEVWLGGSAANHNRWVHSVGAFNIAYFWMKALETRVPPHCLEWPLDSWEKIRAVVGTAVLLHDYGHLPFAHMMDEVLRSIHWLPSQYGLENVILSYRLSQEPLDLTWSSLLSVLGAGSSRPLKKDTIRTLVQQLINGQHACPWLQAIVNSAIDADKVDYLRFDTEFISELQYPVRHRLLQTRVDQWFTDFLLEQEVNHVGMLCLHGRSAVAAADLWRERIFFYDRLYLSSALRVPERMAFEIVQQFLIRSTLSSPFLKKVGSKHERAFGQALADLSTVNPCSPDDLIRLKCDTVRETLLELLPKITDDMLEFALLKEMMSAIKDWPSLDVGYRNFLESCFACLEQLDSRDNDKHCSLPDIIGHSLVREPLLCDRSQYEDVRELLRPLQHVYCREMLIDLVRLPRVLSAPRRWTTSFDKEQPRGMDYGILVPSGSIKTWASGKRASQPLADSVVQPLERPYCRISVIAPGLATSPRGAYLWDRVRAALMDGGIHLLESEGEGDEGFWNRV